MGGNIQAPAMPVDSREPGRLHESEEAENGPALHLMAEAIIRISRKR
jgi:hypothetical protein